MKKGLRRAVGGRRLDGRTCVFHNGRTPGDSLQLEGHGVKTATHTHTHTDEAREILIMKDLAGCFED